MNNEEFILLSSARPLTLSRVRSSGKSLELTLKLLLHQSKGLEQTLKSLFHPTHTTHHRKLFLMEMDTRAHFKTFLLR